MEESPRGPATRVWCGSRRASCIGASARGTGRIGGAEPPNGWTGLQNPRGVAVAASGDVCVAEAGSGGSTQLGDVHLGPTGQITGYRPATGASRVVADGFISVATEEGTLGLGGVITQGSTLYATVGGAPQFLTGGPSSPGVDLGRAQLGQLIAVTPGGQHKNIAGVGATNFGWTATQPVSSTRRTGRRTPTPYGALATPTGVLLADAGATTSIWSTATGRLRS